MRSAQGSRLATTTGNAFRVVYCLQADKSGTMLGERMPNDSCDVQSRPPLAEVLCVLRCDLAVTLGSKRTETTLRLTIPRRNPRHSSCTLISKPLGLHKMSIAFNHLYNHL